MGIRHCPPRSSPVPPVPWECTHFCPALTAETRMELETEHNSEGHGIPTKIACCTSKSNMVISLNQNLHHPMYEVCLPDAG